MYFLSEKKLESLTLYPRIPESKGPLEEDTIPRVCVGPSIGNCLTAIGPGKIRVNSSGDFEDEFPEFNVYKTSRELKEYSHVSFEELHEKDWVGDAKFTGECWILEPVELVYVGTIKILEHETMMMRGDLMPFKINIYTYEMGGEVVKDLPLLHAGCKISFPLHYRREKG